ncbi:hypothetical protein H6G17_18625 [Chroococcidiopsis sp. FACHB-1243]|uniref:hypothetical protein n=1 Tax=Chroococcidiopsis sp. [FACHB-1243] TaxID=2692781 RepID=UPI001780E63D|nr:hypothetical protein [Chroococcidiopsis sp. [FACHB-1243]]MBD2307492.1 hypothetical protein [Chroococcidiopsis sp. [FACHB-1243]]
MRAAILGGTGIHLLLDRIDKSYHRSVIPSQKRLLPLDRAICPSDRIPTLPKGRSHFYFTKGRSHFYFTNRRSHFYFSKGRSQTSAFL